MEGVGKGNEKGEGRGQGKGERMGEDDRQGRRASHDWGEGECSGACSGDRWGSEEERKDRDGGEEDSIGRDVDIQGPCICRLSRDVPAAIGFRAPSVLAPCVPEPDPRARRGDGLGAREARGE